MPLEPLRADCLEALGPMLISTGLDGLDFIPCKLSCLRDLMQRSRADGVFWQITRRTGSGNARVVEHESLMHIIRNDGVGGSNPSCGTIVFKCGGRQLILPRGRICLSSAATFSAKGIDDATPTTITLAAKSLRGCIEGEALSGAPVGPGCR